MYDVRITICWNHVISCRTIYSNPNNEQLTPNTQFQNKSHKYFQKKEIPSYICLNNYGEDKISIFLQELREWISEMGGAMSCVPRVEYLCRRGGGDGKGEWLESGYPQIIE